VILVDTSVWSLNKRSNPGKKWRTISTYREIEVGFGIGFSFQSEMPPFLQVWVKSVLLHDLPQEHAICTPAGLYFRVVRP